jgi:hypothetical protein
MKTLVGRLVCVDPDIDEIVIGPTANAVEARQKYAKVSLIARPFP